MEAGLRSFDDSMPEEINRRLTDQLCALLFVTSPEAIGHLAREGRPADAVHLVGNPMIDTLLASMDRFDTDAARTGLALPDRYVVATLNRPSNVDEPAAAAALVMALHEVAGELLRVPCLTLRPNTERPVTVTSGSNRLVTRHELASAVLKACDDGPYAGELPPLWDGQAGPRIARVITAWLDQEGRQ